ncbi:MAG TPA: TIR domain-containing protein [Pyrinomonadaceae bacterium]|jgi:CheY-like chemotaxis protein
MNKKKILLVDDDPFFVERMKAILIDEGLEVITSENVSSAKQKIKEHNDTTFILLDIRMPSGEDSDLETQMGYKSGVVLARWVKQNYPQINIVGLSADDSLDVKEWFRQHSIPLFEKGTGALQDILNILLNKNKHKQIRTFIAHGHDDAAKYQLKNYLQNTLHLPEPIILHEQASLGRTIIEKFEEFANQIDVVFVLLTPDDIASGSLDALKKRARQNVIFEMGYFFSKLQRRKGKVILLYKGQLEPPSDISGIIYIDISNGIEAAGEQIRKELSSLLER